MVNEALETELEEIARTARVIEALKLLLDNSEINSYLEQANKLSMSRLGYNDHGRVHSKIVALNALKIFDILFKKGINPNTISESVGDEEDARIAILLGAYLHDIGCAVSRDNHELIAIPLVEPVVRQILFKVVDKKIFGNVCSFIFEAIACHMGTNEATSLEAKIVEVADSTDITKGRARIPFHIGKADIHKFSALAVEEVRIMEGEKKALKFEIYMDNPAGIFQAEETMLRKIKSAKFENYVEMVAKIKDEEEFRYL